MNKLEFTASVIGSVAWPLVVVIALLLFRKTVRSAAATLVAKTSGQVEFMSLRLAWQQQLLQAEEAVEQAVESQEEPHPEPPVAQVRREPTVEWLDCMQMRTAMVLDLRRALEFKDLDATLPQDLGVLSRQAAAAGIITLEMHEAVANCSALFDLLVLKFVSGTLVNEVPDKVHQLLGPMQRIQGVIASVVSRLVTESKEIDPRP